MSAKIISFPPRLPSPNFAEFPDGYDAGIISFAPSLKRVTAAIAPARSRRSWIEFSLSNRIKPSNGDLPFSAASRTRGGHDRAPATPKSPAMRIARVSPRRDGFYSGRWLLPGRAHSRDFPVIAQAGLADRGYRQRCGCHGVDRASCTSMARCRSRRSRNAERIAPDTVGTWNSTAIRGFLRAVAQLVPSP
jgi:hypothetical protein